MSLFKEAQGLLEEIRAHRRYLHQHAEVGMDLPVTVAYVREQLQAMGYEPQDVGGGIVALAGGKQEGKVFLIRADMDALPIVEESEIPFKSETGNMHACGHDCHTSMLLGAARLLKNHEEEIKGQVKLMFQPAEESLLGARSMVEAGLMENPKVNGAMAIHMMAGIDFPSGHVVVLEPGVATSAADWYEIHVKGQGCHGAMPNTGIDPLNVLAHIFIGLQTIHAREMPTGSSLALTVGQMHGGRVSNVIPDTAYMTGTIRTISPEVRALVKTRMKEIAEGIGATFGAEVTVKFTTECPCIVNDEDMYAQVTKYIEQLLGKEQLIDLQGETGLFMAGSEDFALIAEKVPSSFVGLSGGSKEEGYTYPLHHPKARFNEDVLPVGSAVYVSCAMEWLENN